MKLLFIGSLLLTLSLGNICAAASLMATYSSNVLSKDALKSISLRSPSKTAYGFEPVFQRGMSYTTYANMTPDAYASVESDESLRHMRSVNVEWVAVNVIWFQRNATSKQIHPLPDKSPSNSSVVHVIKEAHSLGMKVMLKPMIDLEDGEWRGNITPSIPWFQSYSRFIFFFAELAEQNGVEMFCIGTELNRTVTWEKEWRQIIEGVRERYSGLLTYAALWWREYDQLIKWWDALDYVGINAYFPLSNVTNPTLTEMKATWDRITRYIDEIHSIIKKPIIFTEIGYLSTDGTNVDPSNWKLQLDPQRRMDLQEQADCYEVAFESLWNKSWFYGFYWWYWQTNPNVNGSNNRDYTPQNKPAQGVLTHWYSQPRLLETKIVLKLSSQCVYVNTSIGLKAKLLDESNYSIPNETIQFFLYFEDEKTHIGSAETDSEGVATITYTPNKPGLLKIEAKFLGSQNYRASTDEGSVLVMVIEDSTFLYTYIIGGLLIFALTEAIAIVFLWKRIRRFRKPNI